MYRQPAVLRMRLAAGCDPRACMHAHVHASGSQSCPTCMHAHALGTPSCPTCIRPNACMQVLYSQSYAGKIPYYQILFDMHACMYACAWLLSSSHILSYTHVCCMHDA